jgi:RHS repeat-associated protein
LTSTVTFNGIVAAGRGRPATSWSSTSITLAVPGGATAGNVVVTVGGVASNGVNFAVNPVIQSISPVSGLAGTVVTVTGTGFGNSVAQGSSTVTFNGLAVAPSTWGSTSFTVAAPAGVSAGKVVATVGGQVSNGVMFTPTPVINSVSPTAGGSGTAVTISGSNFGGTQGTVSFNGVAAGSITAWSNLSITATVPNNTTTGNVVVAVNGVVSNGVTFTLTPAISGLSPNPVLANELVTISGNNFGSSSSAGTVSFNGIPATPTSWSNTSIGILVPGNATAGSVVVAVNGAASNGVAYTLVPPYSFSLSYAPNSNVLTANDSVNGNWTYTYDDFNRLATANNSSPLQGFSYLYDSYGNRWQQALTAGTGGRAIFTFNGNATATSTGNCYHAAGLTNQLDSYCYDAAGNLLNDGQHNYTYDAENRIVSVDNGQTGVYTYEGSGQRIRKVSGTQTVDYLYDLSGQVITELNTFGGWNRTEIYAGGRHLATYNSGTTYFAQSDRLGSERVHSLPSGAPAEICSNLPFGDGLNCTGSIDPSPNHFTGKERDQESQLDYFGARYYASSMGRFMTPDWAAKATAVPYADFGNPQSLNLYVYVGNNPLSRADADGHCWHWLWGGTCKEDPAPPPPPPAPKPPAVITPSTPQNRLANAQDAAMANPKNQPVGTPGTPDRKTFCNIATCQIVTATGTTTDGLINAHGQPNLANTDAKTLANSPSWHQVTPQEAQNLANQGVTVVGVISETGHGHIVTVRPELLPGTQDVAAHGPLVNNIGGHVGVTDGNNAFRGATPTYYAPTNQK